MEQEEAQNEHLDARRRNCDRFSATRRCWRSRLAEVQVCAAYSSSRTRNKQPALLFHRCNTISRPVIASRMSDFVTMA